MARDLYERIQKRAYEIWENEGRPEGAAFRHWEQATDDLTGDDEHETLQDLIDEDDLNDARSKEADRSETTDVEITTGGEGVQAGIRAIEGP